MWTFVPATANPAPANANCVESTPFDPTTPPSLTAFLSYFDPNNLTAPDTYNASYRLEVFDDATHSKVGGIEFQVTGSATEAHSVNVIFALDHGFTMGARDAARATRLARLKAAFSRGIALLRDDDTFGFISFGNPSCASNPSLALGPGDSGRQTTARTSANGLSVDLSNPLTKCIQTGIDVARGVTTTATLVILTDGVNIDPAVGGLTRPTLPTSALIIIENAALPPASAALMVSADGHYAIATAQTLGEFAIEKLLTQLFIGLAGSVFIQDPEGSLKPGESQRYPIHLTEADHDLELIVFSNDADVLEVALVDDSSHSDRRKHEPKRRCGSNDPRDRDTGVLVERYALPPVKDQVRPRYEVEISRDLRAGSSKEAPVKFNLLVVAKTDLMLDAQLASSGTTVGSELLFSAVLSQFGHAWDFLHAKVMVELTHPDGFLQVFELPHAPHAPGRFQFGLRTFRAGTYTAHFIAEGKSLVGKFPFRRECLRTIAVFPAGENCPPRPCC